MADAQQLPGLQGGSPAGYGLDQEVARRVMGWTLQNYESGLPAETPDHFEDAANNDGWEWIGRAQRSEAWAWRPSRAIECAWEVVTRLGELGLYVTISKPPDAATWDARGWKPEANTCRYIAHGETAPLAICRAALDAIDEIEKEAAR